MKNDIINLIDQRKITDITECEKDVLRFSNQIGQNKLSSIYIDYSNVFFETSGNILERHRSIVEAEYFKAKGSLQWNFYYYYVLDNDQYLKLKNTKPFKEVEEDTNYSRKRIVNLEILKSSYPFSCSIDKMNEKKSNYNDLSSEWIKILKDNDLDEVYSEEKQSSFDAAIDRYLIGQPIKEIEIIDEATNRFQAISPTGIEELQLEEYRSFPNNESFKFSDINLIEGVNGKGKTSLMEAIELLMCGKTYRHEKVSGVEEAKISIKYKGANNFEKYESKNLKKYQERENFWYGIPSTHNKNTLFRSFNRFNFFNTDASFRFSTGTEPEVIWKSFEALALGGKTAELGKRIDGFSARFSTAEKKLENEIQALKVEIGTLEKSKEAIKSQSQIRQFDSSKVNALLANLGLDASISTDSEESFFTTQILLEKILNKLQRVEAVFSDRGEISIHSALLFLSECKEFEKSFSKVNASVDQANILKRQKHEEISKLNDRKTRYDRLRQYANNEKAIDSIQEESKLEQLRASLQKKQSALNSIALIDLIDMEHDSSLIKDEVQNNQQKAEHLKIAHESVERKIKNAKDSMENIKSILMEIKSLGRQFLLVSESSHCPLCETEFDRVELEKRIGKIELETENYSSLIEERNNVAQELKASLERLESSKKILNALAGIGIKSDDLTLTVAKKLLKKEMDQLHEGVKSLEDAQRKLKMIYDLGYSTNELRSLLKYFNIAENIGTAIVIREIELTGQSIESDYLKLNTEYQEVFARIENIKSAFYNEFPEHGHYDFSPEMKNMIHEEIFRIKSIDDDAAQIGELLVQVKDSMSLKKIYSEMLNVSNEILSYTAYLSKVKQETLNLKNLETQIATKNKEKENLALKHLNAQKANGVFNKIKNEYGVENAVKNFFSQNKEIILEIFKAIHTPNEFEDIQIDDNNIFVVKNGTRRELSKISTGQRTAVALSVFLGMHLSCPMAPKMILLDDPIAFVDDLNVLAVLDFLREIVLRGNRQLFFSTANKKLAHLFKRKFDLLGPAFKVITPNSIQ